MTWRTTESCKRCGAHYEIEIWDLGHKESDSISCRCCGNILREWKNEAKSFSISGVLSRGNMQLKYDDIEKYIGKRFRFQKDSIQFEGEIVGLGDSVMAISPTLVIKPWVVRTAEKDIHLHPENDWQICGGEKA